MFNWVSSSEFLQDGLHFRIPSLTNQYCWSTEWNPTTECHYLPRLNFLDAMTTERNDSARFMPYASTTTTVEFQEQSTVLKIYAVYFTVSAWYG